MKQEIFEIVALSPLATYSNTKGEGVMRQITFKEWGGTNQYTSTLFGERARREYTPGELILAVLGFETQEVNGTPYQRVKIKEMTKLNQTA